MLLKEGKIGNVKLKNRIIMLPTVTNLSNEGFVSEREVEYYKRRSKGVSLVIVGASYVNKLGKFFVNQIGIDDDDKIQGLRKLSEVIHQNGAQAAIQLAMHNPKYKPSDFTKEQIQGFVQDFISGAIRAKKAGFDAVELHFAHGWFVNQFLSPDTNKRTDEYGGNFEGRTKFALDILREVKKTIPEMTVICRINGSDFTDEGFTIEESARFAKLLEYHGADALDISGGVSSTSEYHISPMGIEDKPLIGIAKRIKENVTIPVIAVDKLGSVYDWEKILEEGIADFIGIARGLIGDPDLVKKLIKGQEDIRYCIHCNQACIAYIQKGLSVSCMINPEVGREKEFEVKTDKPLNIAVIGGGPAGMSAAKYLAKKGHNVTLFERENKLGGQLNVAKVPPHKQEIGKVIEYLENDLKKYNVKVHLNKKISLNEIKEMPYDKIVIATGSKPAKINLDADIKPYTAIEVLEGNIPKGKDIAIIGGGLTGLETAEYLAEKGKNVTVLEIKGEVGEGIYPMVKKLLLNRLKELKVDIITNALIKEISGGKLMYTSKDTYKVVKVEDVVLAVGNLPDTEFEELKNENRYYFIGDCKTVASAVEAIRDGAELSLII
ncbi:NAD(P)/FAD-dependent oxidoreductase [Thermoanaerobacter wiegelii]|uniref:NADH:flavin oxidoreductase/NADH oxidase n=1 Tax=Thermoanaerobacter wiegelii Rt8.B1 TaxID=697303 RepID=G2MSB1_9THEO|nr:NAD(P)/FAD-dependent oxidoreductase [Thermoanaerobacter wiegelii]AEM78505.1 NADH:flavin oxidoreductase/NADH oxidase [Thermoanaerobacter wiegelii Rt8.B1]